MHTRFPRFLIPCGLLLLVAGCAPERFRRAADEDVAGILAEKAPRVPGFEPGLSSIATLPLESLEGLPRVETADAFLGESGEKEVGARRINLQQALRLATRHNRSYQSRKEMVYLDALGLTLARYRYNPIFSGGGQVDYREVRSGVDDVIERDRTGTLTGGGNLSFGWLLRTGGRLAASVSTDFLRYIVGQGSTSRQSALAATLTQPLLRGQGYRVAMEALTQSERNVLYSLRDFVRYRQEFSVQVASAYYRVLLDREFARNAHLGLENFRRNAAEERELVAEGRRSLSQLGQLEQAELSAESSWINSVRNYIGSLDDFKVRHLGLSASTSVVFDPADLERLEIVHPELTRENAVEISFASRLDLLTAQDRVEDAARQVRISENALRPRMDLVLSGTLPSAGNDPFRLDPESSRWNMGMDMDLPLDRRSERNAYRSSIIGYDRSLRQAQLRLDEIQLEVTENLRSLDQARRQFEISEIGVQLGNRRIEEEELRSELALGTARDLVEAQTDLINALNQRTSALVNHTITRLQFWSSLGILEITGEGHWKEPDEG